MKKLLLFFTLIILLAPLSHATVYYPFPSTNGSWNYRYYDAMNLPTLGFTSYTLAGDTSIMGNTYHKILKNYTYTGAFRENSKVIYFVPDTSIHEYVLYDFNLTVGDTVKNRFGPAVCTNGIVTIQSVDSVLMQNGYHRRLSLSSNPQWVEGIGSFFYLLEPSNFLCVSGNDLLECKAGDTGIDYASNASLCIVGVTKITKSNFTISVEPNPFTSSITIKSNTSEQGESFKIVDYLGRTVNSGKLDATQSRIDLTLLEKGIYFIRVNMQVIKVLKI